MTDEQWMEKVIEFCQQNPDGITNDMFKSKLGLEDLQIQTRIINNLLGQETISIHQKGNVLLYRFNKGGKSKNDEEKIVLSIIENAGNKGIWTKDIRFESNIPAIYLNKVLKQMESKKLIKTVKSVNASKKKLYMLYDIEPDTSVTGGTWYSNQDFEVEFVDILNQQCLRFLEEKRSEVNKKTSNPLERIKLSYANSKEVWTFIKNLGISKVDLSIKDIESILQTLIFDGKIECEVTASSSKDGSCTKLYRALVNNIGYLNIGLLKSPCGGCPIMKDCHEGGIISPATCSYLKDWIDY